MPTYTTVADVKRVLRSSAGGKMRFPDNALDSVLPFDSNDNVNTDMTIDKDKIVADGNYTGETFLKFVFTDATNFEVYSVDTALKKEVLIDTGSVAVTYTTPDGLIDVQANAFSGTIEAGDVIELKLKAHMSNTDLESYIDDAEVEIDTALSEGRVDYLDLGGGETRLLSGTIHPSIALATQYLSAYYVYTDVFVGSFTQGEDAKRSYATRWRSKAEKVLGQYIISSRRGLPKVISFPSFVDKFGLKDVGPDPDENKLETTHADITRDANSDDIFDPD